MSKSDEEVRKVTEKTTKSNILEVLEKSGKRGGQGLTENRTFTSEKTLFLLLFASLLLLSRKPLAA